MEVLGMMPNEFLARYTAPEIAEIQAYYRNKAEDAEKERKEREAATDAETKKEKLDKLRRHPRLIRR